MIGTDDHYRLLAEVANGVSAEESTLPATAEMAELRADLEREVAEIRAAGYGVEVPHEIPEADETPFTGHG